MLKPFLALPALNFFMGDIGGGLGPFLATWLVANRHWGPERIGAIGTAMGIAYMVASTPMGWLVDRLGQPRLATGVAAAAIVTGTLLLFPAQDFWPLLATQVLVALGGALGGPGLTGITLAVTGRSGFTRQQGVNAAAAHAGNVVAAGIISLAAIALGGAAAFVVLAFMAGFVIVTLLLMQRDAVDANRMSGHDRAQPNEAARVWKLLSDPPLLMLGGVILLFNLGNGAMLSLMSQRLASGGGTDPTVWVGTAVVVAQLVMIPASLLAGHVSNSRGRRIALFVACIVLAARGVLAMTIEGKNGLIAAEVLDGISAGLVSVAQPAAIADLTYGGGRTQTAMGAVGAAQSAGGAVSALLGGVLAQSLGWDPALGVLALFPLLAAALLVHVALQDSDRVPAHAARFHPARRVAPARASHRPGP